jgi:cytoskeletal protein CcmA (bactofilin family)
MKKFFTTLVLALCASFCPLVCSAKKVIKENREIGTFRKISTRVGINVYFTQTDSYSLVVEANDDLIDKLSTTVEGETLVIEWRGSIKRETGVFNIFKQTVSNVYVSAPALDAVNTGMGADFYADKLKCEGSFNLSVSGGADADIKNLTVAENADIAASVGADVNVKTLIVAGNINISASNGTNVDVKTLTVTGNTNISTSIGGDCDIKTLQTNNCNLAVNNGSDIDVGLTASGNLNIRSSVGGGIRVTGKAIDVKISVSHGADVNIKKLSYNAVDIHKSVGGKVRQ